MLKRSATFKHLLLHIGNRRLWFGNRLVTDKTTARERCAGERVPDCAEEISTTHHGMNQYPQRQRLIKTVPSFPRRRKFHTPVGYVSGASRSLCHPPVCSK